MARVRASDLIVTAELLVEQSLADRVGSAFAYRPLAISALRAPVPNPQQLMTIRSSGVSREYLGQVAEWFKAAVLKTAVG